MSRHYVIGDRRPARPFREHLVRSNASIGDHLGRLWPRVRGRRCVAPDGSSYFTGTSDSFAVDEFGSAVPRIFLLRFTPTGALDWQRIWNGQTGHGGTAVAVAPDGSVYVTGVSSRRATTVTQSC